MYVNPEPVATALVTQVKRKASRKGLSVLSVGRVACTECSLPVSGARSDWRQKGQSSADDAGKARTKVIAHRRNRSLRLAEDSATCPLSRIRPVWSGGMRKIWNPI